MSGTTRVSRYQKGKIRKVKTNLDLLEQEIVSGSGICWAICKSAPHPRQPRQHPTTHFFTGRMAFLPPNQQRQSTEGTNLDCKPGKIPLGLHSWGFTFHLPASLLASNEKTRPNSKNKIEKKHLSLQHTNDYAKTPKRTLNLHQQQQSMAVARHALTQR